ncbi:hypothetical protein CHCC14821_0013 [Bacillus paralicheniformis]|nr:hypothetical protein CHCC14821_0013 [Bacillus paralicheniformis]
MLNGRPLMYIKAVQYSLLVWDRLSSRFFSKYEKSCLNDSPFL